MVTSYDILVLQEGEDGLHLVRQHIQDHKIPVTVNGESGHHICYVRALTQLLAQWLTQNVPQYAFSPEDIENLALAASLHDVGKARISQTLLDKEGALTPAEYDTVKRHTLLGQQMLEELGEKLDSRIRPWALDVTRCHHERYDGTGYPDGLKGEEIPIGAQIVAIADAYEALTASRSYKKALSREVALEMISSGMCGAFNPAVLEALIHVAGENSLSHIRSTPTAPPS